MFNKDDVRAIFRSTLAILLATGLLSIIGPVRGWLLSSISIAPVWLVVPVVVVGVVVVRLATRKPTPLIAREEPPSIDPLPGVSPSTPDAFLPPEPPQEAPSSVDPFPNATADRDDPPSTPETTLPPEPALIVVNDQDEDSKGEEYDEDEYDEEDWRSYTSDDILEIDWRWRWHGTSIENLTAHCPDCDLEMHPDNSPMDDTGLMTGEQWLHGFRCEDEDCEWSIATPQQYETPDQLHDYVKRHIRREARRLGLSN